MHKLLLAIIIITATFTTNAVSWAVEPDCSKVTHIARGSAEANTILKHIENKLNSYQKNKVKVQYRTIEKAGAWIIAEFDVDILEPGIFVLMQTKNSYKFVAEYGGSDEEPEKTIRLYFMNEVPSAPKELFKCYTPKGAPFRSETK